MSCRSLLVVLMSVLASLVAQAVHADVPGSIDVTCDVSRKDFRSAARDQSEVTFTLWSLSTAGAQVGSDYTVPTTSLIVSKRYTEKFDSVSGRKAIRINAVIGSDGSPVLLPVNGEAWLEVTVGATTLGCDFAATSNLAARRRLQSVAFARESSHSETCGTCATVSPAARTYIEVFIPTDVNQGPLPANTDIRVDFSNELKDDLGEWNTTSKEFTAQNAGLYLVQTSVLFQDVVSGNDYIVRIDSNNEDNTFITKAQGWSMPSATGSQPVAGVSSQASQVLRLDAGEKIWISVDNNNHSSSASLYWRNYDTYLYITRLD